MLLAAEARFRLKTLAAFQLKAAAHFEVQIDTGGGANKNVNALLGERSEASGADREVVVSLWQVLNGVVACIVCGYLPEQTGGGVRRGHRCFGDNGAGRVADGADY